VTRVRSIPDARLREARRALSVALRLLVPVGLVATTWHFLGASGGWERLATASPIWLAAAVLAAQIQIVLSAFRWRLTAGRLGLAIRRRRAVGEYFLAQLVNMTLPGGVVGDAARAGRLRHEAGLAVSGEAVVIERMAGQVALAAVAVPGLMAALILGDLFGGTAWMIVVLTVAVVAVLWRFRRALGARLARWRPLARFGASTRAALLDPAVRGRQIGFGLAIVACNLAAFAFCARATGTPLGPLATVAIVPLILAAMLLPLSVGGWGWREGAAAALFPLVGADAGAGLAASVAFGFVILIAAAPGAVWPMLGTMGPERSCSGPAST
jgi:uncharacterized membrane protein YbhN (UPF0104 family)